MVAAGAASAQQRSGAINATILNDATNEKIVGAVLELVSVADSTQVRHEVSNVEGKVAMANVPYGKYRLKVSILGYEDFVSQIDVNARNMNFGNWFLTESATDIEGVQVATQMLRTSMHGDTLVYNAKAFKTTEDADSDELLRKLPGVTVDEDGTVKAQGEEVTKIFVDGKEFFGSDTRSTMKNIPANVIERVEVFRKMSDYSEYTGVDDGEGFQAMNFVTSMRNGHMGRFSAGYDFTDKYQVSAMYSVFNKDHRLSLNGLSNNTNQINFGVNDFLGAMGGGGGGGGRGGRGGGGGGNMRFGGGGVKSTAHSLGFNYNYEKTKDFKANLSYRYSYNDNENRSESEKEYIAVNDEPLSFDKSYSNGTSDSRNNSHRVDGRVEWQVNDNNRLSLRVGLNFQDYLSSSRSNESQYKLAGTAEELFKRIYDSGNGDRDGFSNETNLNYYLKFNKPGRSFAIEARGSMNRNDADNYTFSGSRMPALSIADTLRRHSINDTDSYGVRGRAIYTEPFSEFWRGTVEYEFRYDYSDRNSNDYKWNFDTERYEAWDNNSNVMKTRNYTHSVGPGISYNKNRDMFSAGVKYQYTILNGERKKPAPVFDSQATFSNVTYYLRWRRHFNPENSLDFSLDSNTNNPSIENLQEVESLSSSTQITRGNADLTPSYTHSGRLGYHRFSTTNNTSLMVMVGGSVTTNGFGDSTVFITHSMLNDKESDESTENDIWVSPNGLTLREGGRYTTKVNSGGSWNIMSMVNFGFPIIALKSNFNVTGGVNYTESNAILNGIKNIANTWSYNWMGTLSGNISEKFDYNVSYNGSYADSKYSVSKESNTHSINHSVRGGISWITWLDFTLKANVSYTYQNSPNFDEKVSYTICNASIGKKIFKNRRGEVSVAVNDLFNQRQTFSHNVTPTYIENRKDEVLKRYFTLNFTYTLRNINSQGRGDRPEGHGGREGRPGMPPGGRFMRMGGAPIPMGM